MTFVAVAAMLLALFLTPLGAPGNWIMVAIVAAGAYFGEVSAITVGVCVIIALIAEVLEYMLVKKHSEKHGGSNKAFWGAIVGGFIGVMVGLPVPLIGSVVAGFLGSFAGAAAVTYMEARDMGQAGRVGWGVLLGRMWAAAIKTAAGMAILVVGGWSLLF